MNSKVVFGFVVLISLINHSAAQCRPVKPVDNFDASKFSGSWYSIQESSSPRLPCLHYNISAASSGVITVNFLPYGFSILSIPNGNASQGYTIQSKLPLMDGATFNLLGTDYANWAVIYVCKDSNNYASITFWSRTSSLTSAQVSTIKGILNANNLPYASLEKMIQSYIPCNGLERAAGDIKAIINIVTPLVGNIASFFE